MAVVAAKFCVLKDLTNEAQVEALFVERLLKELGYTDEMVLRKTSLKPRKISLGSKSVNYKPDYMLKPGVGVEWLIDAKSPNEEITKWIGQCASYAVLVNGDTEEDPLQFFMVTNGLSTNVYRWNKHNKPVFTANLADMGPGSAKMEELKKLLSPLALAKKAKTHGSHKFSHRSLSEVNGLFAWCHQRIHEKANVDQATGFQELIKIVFLKLISDKKIKEKFPELVGMKEFDVPVDSVRFSTDWISRQDAANPLDSIQFAELKASLEADILKGIKKRIFEPGERIDLSPEIIRSIVGKLEHTYLFAVEDDLSGRLFELFLSATMRGKNLGQFFTPRSVVKLGTLLADVKVAKGSTENVLDACCGTGGFLISALADMLKKANATQNLSPADRRSLAREITHDRICGIDIGASPNMARIARMNMHLHGDGGARIYQADSLDKSLRDPEAGASAELFHERDELRTRLESGWRADVVLTNPPFAKKYDRGTEAEAAVLDGYAVQQAQGKKTPSLKSSVMFIERYHNLLADGGRMVAVIDDSILCGSDYSEVRQFIRSRYIVKAVISLPGDAFQRSQARVKTSLIIFEKADVVQGDAWIDRQGDVFMYACSAVGTDDPARVRVRPGDARVRAEAEMEIKECAEAYGRFLKGEVTGYNVPAAAIADRMDVKSCTEKPGKLVETWQMAGIEVKSLADFLVPVEFGESDKVRTKDNNEEVTFLRITYAGQAERGETLLASDATGSELYRIKENQVVISNINAIHGAACVVPSSLAGCVVTNEFTVCETAKGVDPRLVHLLLRSPEARADLLILATGIGRTRIRWANASRLKLPQPSVLLVDGVLSALTEAEKLDKKARELREQASKQLETTLGLANERAKLTLKRYKPPD